MRWSRKNRRAITKERLKRQAAEGTSHESYRPETFVGRSRLGTEYGAENRTEYTSYGSEQGDLEEAQTGKVDPPRREERAA